MLRGGREAKQNLRARSLPCRQAAEDSCMVRRLELERLLHFQPEEYAVPQKRYSIQSKKVRPNGPETLVYRDYPSD